MSPYEKWMRFADIVDVFAIFFYEGENFASM